MGRHRFRVACIVALVLGVHVAALWYLLATSRLIVRQSDTNGLEIVPIVRARNLPDLSAAPEQKLTGRRAGPAAPSHQPAGSSFIQPPVQAEAQSNAIHPPVDWADELNQAAKNATADKSAQAPRDFGFPQLPSAPAKAPQFDWDYAATHRVEQIPEGGILINLNDRCVLILFPFPFMACRIGDMPANGELFKHMGDPAAKSQTP
jgi:hypothetical protein